MTKETDALLHKLKYHHPNLTFVRKREKIYCIDGTVNDDLFEVLEDGSICTRDTKNPTLSRYWNNASSHIQKYVLFEEVKVVLTNGSLFEHTPKDIYNWPFASYKLVVGLLDPMFLTRGDGTLNVFRNLPYTIEKVENAFSNLRISILFKLKNEGTKLTPSFWYHLALCSREQRVEMCNKLSIPLKESEGQDGQDGKKVQDIDIEWLDSIS